MGLTVRSIRSSDLNPSLNRSALESCDRVWQGTHRNREPIRGFRFDQDNGRERGNCYVEMQRATDYECLERNAVYADNNNNSPRSELFRNKFVPGLAVAYGRPWKLYTPVAKVVFDSRFTWRVSWLALYLQQLQRRRRKARGKHASRWFLSRTVRHAKILIGKISREWGTVAPESMADRVFK